MLDDAEPPNAWAVFGTGVLGLGCVPVLAPVAWALGNRYMRICLRQGIEPDPLARLGRGLGLVSTLGWGTIGFVAVVFTLVGYAWTR